MKNCFLTLCLGLLIAGNTVSAAAPPPNVVILLADDLGWNAVGYHSDWARTPNLDRLAGEGIELDRFYVAPMCSPTRAGLLTGRYPIRFGLARAVIPPYRDYGLPTAQRTLAEALADAGYTHRGIFGKWHLGHHRLDWHPLRQGFTAFEGHYNGAIDYFSLQREGQRDWHEGLEPSQRSGYATDLIADAAVEFIRQAAPEEAPYFCYVPFNAPHSPFQAKPEAIARHTRPGRPQREATYLAMIESMDEAIGRILAAIEASGKAEAENTQVWFFSDNGGVGRFERNNRPLRGSKLTTFEGGIRVPACVRWPRAWPGGRTVRQPMGYIDVMPTILASAGVPPQSAEERVRPFDGIDVSDVLSGRGQTLPPRPWFSYHGQPGPEKETMAITTPNWKLVVIGPDLRRAGITDRHRVHLFRLGEDPNEQSDVAAEHPEVVQTLVAKLKTHRELQPAGGVPPYNVGKANFQPWPNWDIRATAKE
ncbi:sulfatase-like hydrolase/transferase [Roseimaritima sediminicola]|uniref:sulfatase-like hydrolase/transferase n=1 Tax=Roseimaritima sediminicola TaxID=2662066 RepID=UPI0012983765|nr:sulfatase-like hydrolase/transferase [Roseimaritima sediminicola]